MQPLYRNESSQVPTRTGPEGPAVAGFLERIYVIALLLYFTGGLVPSAHVEGHPSPTYDRLMILSQLLLFPVLPYLAARHWKHLLPAVRAAKWLVLLCAFAVLSSLWSYGHLYTMRRSLILAISTLFGLYIGARFTREEQARLTACAIGLAIAASMILVALFPTYGISQTVHSGMWKGVFAHKNTLGMTMTFSLLLFTIARPALVAGSIRWLLILGSVILLVESKSQTALVLAVSVPVIYALLHVIRIRRPRTLPLWVACVPALIALAVVVLTSAGIMFDAIGRDATLSGRTELWSAAVGTMSQHSARQWLGYGYSVFWSPENPLMDAIFAQVGWFPGHGHNGYLDIYLDLGILGLLIFLCGLAVAARNAVQLFIIANSPVDRWPIAFLAFFVMCNLTESQILRTHMFLWIPYVATYVSSALTLSAQSTSSDAAQAEQTLQAGPAPVLAGSV